MSNLYMLSYVNSEVEKSNICDVFMSTWEESDPFLETTRHYQI